MKRFTLASIVAAVSALSAPQIQAQVLFSDNFDSDTTANWIVNAGASGNHAATFFFDYSTIGIPSAPNSTGSTTRGLKLEANFGPTAAFSGISVSPLGQNFTGDYILRFDMWMNFNGPLATGGSGSTHLTTAGIGTTGNIAVHANMTNAAAGVWFGATGDGGSGDTTGDYRAYTANGLVNTNVGAYYAGGDANARNDTNPYYNGLGGNTAPNDQLTLFPQQSGTNRIGAAGMRWHEVTITKTNNFINWNIGGVDIAIVDASSLNLTSFLVSRISTRRFRLMPIAARCFSV